ncbi:MAG: integrase arm-type DNA-binding domain-containing protein [Pseudomonadota bacterium]
MAARLLTDRFCEGVKPTPSRQAAYYDAKITGLEFRVSAEGRKVWSLRYRLSDGRQRRMTLGTFPVMDLARARGEAMAALARVAKGEDPAAKKREANLAAKADPIKTFGDLIAAYFAASQSGEWKPKGRPKRASTLGDERRNYRVHIEPTWATKALDDINKAAVKALLRSLMAKGLGARVNRTQALIRQAFAYAIAEERVETNPVLGITRLAQERTRTRILSDDEQATLWKALANPDDLRFPAAEGIQGDRVYVGRRMAIIVQLAMLLLQRRSEIAGMMASELNLDQGTWLIPAERMKSGRPHTVPLPSRAVGLIKEARQLADVEMSRRAKAERRRPNDTPLFPGQRDPENPIRGDSVTHSFRDIAKAIGLQGASLHDLRRIGSTALTSERLGCTHFIRSQVLGHADAGGGAAVSSEHYDRNTYLPEKRAALTAWEGLLLEIVGEVTRLSSVHVLHGSAA